VATGGAESPADPSERSPVPDRAQRKAGQWECSGARLVLAYELRAAVKLARAKTAAAGIKAAFERHCLDLRTKRLVGRFWYHAVPPPDRMWVWARDLSEATSTLGLSRLVVRRCRLRRRAPSRRRRSANRMAPFHVPE
jgi:hypothetical protein